MRDSSKPARHDSPFRARIWLVDDSPLQAEIGRRAIPPEYAVRVFNEGAAMLEALTKGPAPELLILDWQMPELSGLEVCRFIRQTRDAAELPILVLTVSNPSENLVPALEAGANDFVMKPFNPSELRARLAALLRTRALHEKLAEAERRLRMEAQYRESFLGMLAHDLRQPLNTIVLANQAMSAAVARVPEGLLEIQQRAVERMTRMVSQLLDFAQSRPESGMPVELEPMDLAALAAELLEEIRAAHPSRQFELEVDGACVGSWDRDRLAQLYGNLLGNAVEHGSANAPISVRLRREPNAVALSVGNQGEPIPEELLPVIFEPFRRGRVDKSSGGVGLGLHIVSEIARAHGGTVEAKSDANSTVFTVTLPVGPS